MENSASKESERVNFSDEEESEQDISKLIAADFKKKSKVLAAIEEERDIEVDINLGSGLIPPLRSKIDLNSKRSNSGAVASKLLQ
jgi:hypothetical protein